MTLDSLSPLLRGIGTTIILITAVVTFASAQREIEKSRSQRAIERSQIAASADPKSELSHLTKEVEELRSEAEQENIVEEVLENRWFEWLGFIGMATVASSFYVESYARREEKRAVAQPELKKPSIV
jgi:hypothetical protein